MTGKSRLVPSMEIQPMKSLFWSFRAANLAALEGSLSSAGAGVAATSIIDCRSENSFSVFLSSKKRLTSSPPLTRKMTAKTTMAMV